MYDIVFFGSIKSEMTIARPFLTFGDGEDGKFTAIICHIYMGDF